MPSSVGWQRTGRAAFPPNGLEIAIAEHPVGKHPAGEPWKISRTFGRAASPRWLSHANQMPGWPGRLHGFARRARHAWRRRALFRQLRKAVSTKTIPTMTMRLMNAR
jgi:hypothetical protein